MVIRWFYTLCFYLALPFIGLRLLIKSRHNIEYRQRWRERFGYVPKAPEPGGLWIHAVSLGEVVAVTPLIKAIQRDYPQLALTFTTTTPAGSNQIQTIFGQTVTHLYCPYDYPGALRRFLKQVKPKWLILVEKELWPNLLSSCDQNKIPVILANATLSPHSFQRYQRFTPIKKLFFNPLSQVIAQSPADFKRFQDLGIPLDRLTLSPNLKSDLFINPEIQATANQRRRHLFGDRPLWIAASTHESEEKMILAVHRRLRVAFPTLLLLLVPRHKERFERVHQLCQKSGFDTVRHSLKQTVTPETVIYLGDTLGELLWLYSLADFAFVGGSLIPVGGHNPLEASAFGLPCLMGPYDYNCKASTQALANEGGLKWVNDEVELYEGALHWLSQPEQCKQDGLKAQAVFNRQQGGVSIHLTILKHYLG